MLFFYLSLFIIATLFYSVSKLLDIFNHLGQTSSSTTFASVILHIIVLRFLLGFQRALVEHWKKYRLQPRKELEKLVFNTIFKVRRELGLTFLMSLKLFVITAPFSFNIQQYMVKRFPLTYTNALLVMFPFYSVHAMLQTTYIFLGDLLGLTVVIYLFKPLPYLIQMLIVFMANIYIIKIVDALKEKFQNDDGKKITPKK